MKNNTQPTARIGVTRNLVPSGTNVYLKSGQEFEIELFNPTKHNVLGKIYINGEAVSETGLIIKPGRREWLERYIDKPRKFKFDTYEVEAGNSDVSAAIKDNGSIKIEFYKEKIKDSGNYLLLDGNWNNNIYPVVPNRQMPPSFPPQPFWYGTPYNPQQYGIVTTGNIGNTSGSTYDVSCNYSYCNNTFTSDFKLSDLELTQEQTKNINEFKNSLESKVEETGRIEEGSHSSQTFTSVEMDFESIILSSVEYKLLPLSKKPVIASEIVTYCTSCGTKQKKTAWKFCPSCGSKFE